MQDLPHTSLSMRVENGIHYMEKIVSWVWHILLLVIVCNVVLRYLFTEGRVEFEEIQWHLYSIGFLLGIPYALVTDSHIRVDVLRERFSAQTRAWIELYGLLFLLIPFTLLVIINALPFVSYSFSTAEVSQSPGGLPYRWLIKFMLLLGFVILLVAAISRLSRVMCYLFGWPNSTGPDNTEPNSIGRADDKQCEEHDASR